MIKYLLKKLKQPTEKKQYIVNQYIVYPKHGVGQIISIEKATIEGIN